MTLPNFLLGGAPKTATTSLHHYLRQHPDVFMPAEPKEPHFFAAEEKNASREWYESLFAPAGNRRALGEASTSYLRHPAAPRRAAQMLPGVRMVFVLRNPIERAYSHYWFNLNLDSRVARHTFSEEIRHPHLDERHHVEHGMYADHLKRWLKWVPRERLLVLLHDDVSRDTAAAVRSVFEFLGVDPAFEVRTESRLNVTSYPRHQKILRPIYKLYLPVERLAERGPLEPLWRKTWGLRQAVRELLFTSTGGPPPMHPEDVKYLARLYRPQIEWLEEFLGRDLSHWKADPQSPAAVTPNRQ